MVKTMRVVQATKPGGNWEMVERAVSEPGRGQVRIKVQACGICHSDSLVNEGHWPGIQYPRIPGHEAAGVIDAVGPDVPQWHAGQRVGVGWYGGHCGFCESCRRGEFILCQNLQITGISFDGGYADYMITPATSGKATTAALGGLGIEGKLVILGAANRAVEVNPIHMIQGRRLTRRTRSRSAR